MAKKTPTKRSSARKTTRKAPSADAMMAMPVGRSHSKLSNTLLFWLGVFFIAFAVLMVMVYFKQVDEAKEQVWFQQQQAEMLRTTPEPSPSPTPRARAR